MGQIKKEWYKKSQNRYISRICRKASSEPILAKFGMSREVADVITPANLRGYGDTGGRILASPIEMASHPYNSAVQPVMDIHIHGKCDYCFTFLV